MNPDMLKLRARVLQAIRSFFADRGYLEVDTPILAPSLIPESHLEVFRTVFEHPDREARDLYLTPSPEVWIKQLLAVGVGSVFQLGKSFRNGESIGRLHEPEFTMLEYYTVGAGYLESIEVTEALFEVLIEAGGQDLEQYRRARGLEPEPTELRPPFERVSLAQAFDRFGGVGSDGIGNIETLQAVSRQLGMRSRGEESYEELFNRLFVHLVEPEIPTGRPVVLFDYPAAIPTLAASKDGTPWAERWELYLGGLETANCYTEERDPQRVRSFFAAEAARKERSRVPHHVDADYYRIFGENFPFCSGVAMGVDRVLMVLLGERSIKKVMPFSVLE